MDSESNGTDNDDNFLIDDGNSTDDHSISNKNVSEQQKKVLTSQADPSYNFSDYIDIYERIYTFFSRGNNQPWQTLFTETIQQTSTPYRLLYMFLDYTLDTTNGRKHKLIVPLIETFKRIKIDEKDIQLDDEMKENILSKVCRRCALNQLESIVEIFHLRSIENRQFVINFISTQLEQHKDIIFVSQLTKFLQLLELNAISFEKIILPLIFKTQWETIKFVIGDDRNLQQKLLKTIDDLISIDQAIVRSLLAQASIQLNVNSIDTHSLKRAARKLLKQYKFDLQDFPNLAIQEKISFLKTCFVKKYIENKSIAIDDEDEKAWKEQIKDLVQDNRDLKVKLIDLFVDYIDVDSAVEWTQYYNLEDFEIPEQVKIRREEIRHGVSKSRDVPLKPPTWPSNPSETDVYKPAVLPTDIVYIELDSDVDSFLNRLECSRCDVGSRLPFVGFDCETFIDPTQRTLSSQIVSIIQLASLIPSRNQSFYGVFDMLALRLQFDMKSVAEFAQRVFCSQDFILLSYNYAGDTSSLLENYPSMNSALMQGSAVIDLSRVQQHILEHYPDVFPYGHVVASSKSRGLSELVRLCFGKPLDKTQRTSDWRKRPLKSAQLIYSVLDARVLVDIAVFIEERTRSLQIPWSWSDFKGYTWTDKAFKKRTGAQQQSVNTS